VHALDEFLLDLPQFGSHALADRRASHDEVPYLLFPLICLKPRKSNVSGFPSPLRLPVPVAHRPNSIGTDAERFLENLRERTAMFGLELHPNKTRRYWNPKMMSSAHMMTTTSACARLWRQTFTPRSIAARQQPGRSTPGSVLPQRQQTLGAALQAIADQANDRTAFLRLAETLTAFLARLRVAV
jgi:hypothetical protein